MPRLTPVFNNTVYSNYLLIGLFPFFIPVYLWQQGAGVGDICLFVAMTGLGFCFTLFIWDRIRQSVPPTYLIASPLLFEILLLTTLFSDSLVDYYHLLAIINGAYNALFWTHQRLLFSRISSDQDHGKKFGNFQIVSAAMMKLGILSGGILLEFYGNLGVYLVSMLVALISAAHLFRLGKCKIDLQELMSIKKIPLKSVLNFSDVHHSRTIFIADALFLFLESYFWSISLFLVASNSYSKLGMLVVTISIVLLALFILVKNIIDRSGVRVVFVVSTILYTISWLFRSIPDEHTPLFGSILLIGFIAFSTALFRLAFNKRFFDLSKRTDTFRYIVIKSYYSQFFIFVLYAVFGLVINVVTGGGQEAGHLSPLYYLAALISPIFLLYAPKRTNPRYIISSNSP